MVQIQVVNRPFLLNFSLNTEFVLNTGKLRSAESSQK